MGESVDAGWLLEQWGRWARTGLDSSRLRFPGVDPVRRLLGSTVASAMITDEEAAWVDGLVAELRGGHPQEATALILSHVWGLSNRKVAGELGCSPRTAQALLERGTFWVEGRMAAGG